MASFYPVTLSDFFSNDWPRGWRGGGKTRLKFSNLDCSSQLQGGNKNLKKSRAIRVSSIEVDMGMTNGGDKCCGHSGSTEHRS